MDNSNNLYSEDDEFAVPETQELPATFSRNIIKRLGIRRTSSGTDTANPNSNTNVTGHYHKPCKWGISLHLLYANYRIRSSLILCRYPRAVDHLYTLHAVERFLCIYGSSTSSCLLYQPRPTISQNSIYRGLLNPYSKIS